MIRKLFIAALMVGITSTCVFAQAPTRFKTYLNSSEVRTEDHPSGSNSVDKDSTRDIAGGTSVIDTLRLRRGCVALAIGLSYTPDSGVDTVLTCRVVDISDGVRTIPSSLTTDDSLRVPVKIESATAHSGRVSIYRMAVDKTIEITTTNSNVSIDSAKAFRLYVDELHYSNGN